MAFGDRIKGALANLGTGGATGGGGWYLGKNVGMQPGQAANILKAGGPGAIALQFLLRDKGVPESEIQAATMPQRERPQRERPQSQRPARLIQPKTDYTPLLIGGGVLLAAILLMGKK